MKWANMCDMTAGFAVESHNLALEINVPTLTQEEHDLVSKAIQKTIEECGYAVNWIPSI